MTREIRAYCAINADATATKFPTNVHGHSSIGHILIISARGCMSIAVAFLTVKALRSCARFPRNLIVHGTAFFASFAARVALAFAFLMLRNNTTSYNATLLIFFDEYVKYSILLSLVGDNDSIILHRISGKLCRFTTLFLSFFFGNIKSSNRTGRIMYSLEKG